METSPFDIAAAEISAGLPPAGQGSGVSSGETLVLSTDPKPKRTRKPKQPAAPTQPMVAPAEPSAGIVNIPPDQIEAALGPFLESMAKLSKTSGPQPAEVKGMASNLSFGLANSKVAIGANANPWTPLVLASLLYSLPRVIEFVINKADERTKKEEEKAAKAASRFPVAAAAVARADSATAVDDGPASFLGHAVTE